MAETLPPAPDTGAKPRPDWYKHARLIQNASPDPSDKAPANLHAYIDLGVAGVDVGYELPPLPWEQFPSEICSDDEWTEDATFIRDHQIMQVEVLRREVLEQQKRYRGSFDPPVDVKGDSAQDLLFKKNVRAQMKAWKNGDVIKHAEERLLTGDPTLLKRFKNRFAKKPDQGDDR